MGRRGAKPQPTALKIARGNPGKRALNAEEPVLPPADLSPPADLTGAGLDWWNEQGPMLVEAGVLTKGDMKCFEVTARIVGDEARFVAACEKVGAEAAHQVGYYATLLKIRGQLKQYLAELGGTPSSRSGVKAKKPVDAGDARRRRFFGKKLGMTEGTA